MTVNIILKEQCYSALSKRHLWKQVWEGCEGGGIEQGDEEGKEEEIKEREKSKGWKKIYQDLGLNTVLSVRRAWCMFLGGLTLWPQQLINLWRIYILKGPPILTDFNSMIKNY